MPTKKIADLPRAITCMSPDHRPPTMMVWPEGVWQHTCSMCGEVTEFTMMHPQC